MSTATKIKGMLATFAVIAILIAVAPAFQGDRINGYPVLSDRKANDFSLSVTFTPTERPEGTIEVIAQLNGAPLMEEWPTESPWMRPTHVPPGSTILLRAWQASAGTITCTILKNGKKVAERTTHKLPPAGAYCEYVNPV